jgi:hypothetical protein
VAVASAVEIMNSALRKVGAERIVSEDDNSNRARLVKDAYPRVRDLLLRSHPWNFSTNYSALALVDPQPEDVFDYDYVFALPADCSRVFLTDLENSDKWEEIAGQRLACDRSEVTVKYGKRVTDVTKFDDAFAEVLAWMIAADISFALTQSATMAAKVQDDAKKALREARSMDAQVGNYARVIATDFSTARR